MHSVSSGWSCVLTLVIASAHITSAGTHLKPPCTRLCWMALMSMSLRRSSTFGWSFIKAS
eukprot:1974627-Alexandrium_andersonii.AAC.1